MTTNQHGTVYTWELVDPETGVTVFHGRSRHECEDYQDEVRDGLDLYRDGLLIHACEECEFAFDSFSDADPGL